MAVIFNIMLSGGRGGLEAMGFLYADAVARLGCESFMLCNRASNCASDKRVTRCAEFFASRLNPLNYYRLYKLISRYRPQILMCHGRLAILLSLFVARFLKYKPKIIGVAHSARLKDFDKLDGVIAVSKSVRDWLIGKYGVDEGKVKLCENALEVPDEVPARPNRSETVIGFMGRFHEIKGIDLLLKAAAELKAAGKRFRIVLAGDGPIAGELKAEAERLGLAGKAEAERLGLAERIEWLGWTSDKVKFYSLVDIAVIPSRIESFGLTVVEAMAHQRAVVVSDCEAPKQIVEGAKCGLVFKREDAAGLADCLERLIDSPELCAELAAKGRAAALRDYSLTRFDRDLSECINAFR